MTKCDHIVSRLRAGWNEMAVRDGILETNLPSTAKLLLLGLVAHQDGTARRRVQVGVRRLAHLATSHKDTAAAWLRRLADEGWIVITPAPRHRTPEVLLADLPAAIVAALVSGSKGHQTEGPCPNPRDTGVLTQGTPPAASVSGRCPDRRSSVSGSEGSGVLTGGTQGTYEGTIEGTIPAHAPATPSLSAAGAPAASSRGRGRGAPGDGKPKASARGAKPTKPCHPDTDSLKLHYVSELKRTRQADAVFQNWGRAQRGFSDLLELVGKEKAEAVITTALADPYTKKIQPWELVSDANKHMGTAPKPSNGNRRHPEPQPTHGASLRVETVEV